MYKVKLGDILLAEGFITATDVEEALTTQKTDKTKRLGQILIDQEKITESQLLLCLSKHINAPIVDFRSTSVNVDAVALVPKALSMRYNMIVIEDNGYALRLAVNDPLDFYAIEDIKSVTGKQCDVVLATKGEILSAIERYYSQVDAKQAARTANKSAKHTVSHIEEIDTSSSDAPVVSLINQLLLNGQSSNASDIHIEPFETSTAVRMRIDGQIIEHLTLSSALHQSVIARIKILSGLDIAEKRLPQDGHFKIRIDKIDLNIRVSIIPTIYGEKVVLRFLSQNAQIDNDSTFGMSEENHKKINKILKNPHGIVYITGPTGSGKTTTLYMIIEELTKLPVNICTIEDPVERNIAKVNQTQVNPVAGLTFESGLRSLLRQDPDIIMVGETRDGETASISVSASITGHLVFSTLHTNDAISAIIRLVDMGIEDYLIANSLVGIVAQRLVKKICPECKVSYKLSEEEMVAFPHARHLYHGIGCPHCNSTGYKGRTAIHEILEIDGVIRSMISRKEPIDNIYDHVRAEKKIKFLQDSIYDLTAQGITTFEEYKKFSAFMR